MSTLQNVETLVAQLGFTFGKENSVLVEKIATHLQLTVDEFPAKLFFHIADLLRPLSRGPQIPPCTRMGGLLARIVKRVIANRFLPEDAVIERHAQTASEQFGAQFEASWANTITAKNLERRPDTTDEAVIHGYICGGFGKMMAHEDSLRTTLGFLKALMGLIDKLFVEGPPAKRMRTESAPHEADDLREQGASALDGPLLPASRIERCRCQGRRSTSPVPVVPVDQGNTIPPLAPVVPVKRGRGRPRKVPLAEAGEQAPSPSPGTST